MRNLFLSGAAVVALALSATTADAQYRGRGNFRVYTGGYYPARTWTYPASYYATPYSGGYYSTPYTTNYYRSGVTVGVPFGGGSWYYPGGYTYYPRYGYWW